MCGLCHVTALKDLPVVGLKCRHVFHAECVYQRIKKGRSTKRINFDFLNCPICKELIELNPAQAPAQIVNLIQANHDIKQPVEEMVQQMILKDGIDRHERVTTASSPYYQKPLKFMFD